MDVPTLPIIVGITGKRDLGGEDEAVRISIGAAFDLLDKKFKDSRKLLVSALAEGADTLTAEAALGRRDWTVVAVLPLAPDLYAQDFDAAAADKLHRLMDDPRIRVRTLAPLEDPRFGEPFTAAALARVPGQSNPDRADHYEQVGLFIAENCALMIAVMEAGEKPDRIGGTARIVDYRLTGRLDPDRERVLGRSRELRPHSPLDSPQTGPVWLLDLASAAQAFDPLRPLQVWLPQRLDTGSPEPPRRIEIAAERILWKRKGQLTGRLRLLDRINAFNQLVADERWQSKISTRNDKPQQDAVSALRWMRAALSTIQGHKKTQLTITVRALALLFLAAVFCLLLESEFEAPIGYYCVIILMIFVTYGLTRGRRLQQFVEDYRAVAEALRIQIVWWHSGLFGPRCSVDKYFLRGTVGALGLVRSVVRQSIASAQLEYPLPAEDHSAAESWVLGQINFFQSRIRARRWRVYWCTGLVWFLFCASAGMAVALIDGIAEWLLEVASVWTAAAVLALLWAAAAGLILIPARRAAAREPLFVVGDVIAFVCGMAGGAILFHFGGENGRKFVSIAVAFSASLAGAVRFIMDQLAWEPELHSYREALIAFTRARDRLSLLRSGDGRRAELIFALGRYALKETESWIRTHRLRPVEPMH